MTALDALIAETLLRPVPAEIAAMADHVRGQHRGVRAVLAYGSCLRGAATTESLIDLYVLTRDFTGVSANAFSSMACRAVPPNVYYAECEFQGRCYRAKYAVLPLTQFSRWMTASNPYFWARFSQPSAMILAADEAARRALIAAIAQAARTMYGHARALQQIDDSLAIWSSGFQATYRTELRAESGEVRAVQVVEANANYYQALSTALSGTGGIAANWRWKRFAGKLWAVARLIKASFTFTGGADYIVWKIERHTGQKIALSAWQRRHPVLAGLILLPKLLASRAVR